MAESIQTLPYLEVSEWEDLEDSGCQERMSLCDRQRYGQDEEGLKRMEQESAEDEAEEEWTETLGKGGLELSSRGEDYSKMIDTQGDEECVFWSPTETQDFFSGYEKHFMPNPLEV